MEENKLIVFQEKAIRRTWHNEEWYFSVSDVVGVLSESKDPKAYWRKLKQRENQLMTLCHGLKLPAKDGKMRKEDCSNTQGLFRIIQSIPSKKAEPFKQWLAKVGYERIQEIENPELAAERARQYYRDLGYDENWINKRLQSIIVRGELTDEWKERGVKEGREYAILTAEIAKATFGFTPSEHREVKNLKRENLRDHMTNLELIFAMLGEESTKQEVVNRDSKGFYENKNAAKAGGKAAGKALEAYEKQTGNQVVSSSNFKSQIQAAKEKKKLESKKEK
jgi:DNA-damage-inducible protein D